MFRNLGLFADFVFCGGLGEEIKRIEVPRGGWDIREVWRRGREG